MFRVLYILTTVWSVQYPKAFLNSFPNTGRYKIAGLAPYKTRKNRFSDTKSKIENLQLVSSLITCVDYSVLYLITQLIALSEWSLTLIKSLQKPSKNMNKADFDQPLECPAPNYWSKYTTLVMLYENIPRKSSTTNCIRKCLITID